MSRIASSGVRLRTAVVRYLPVVVAVLLVVGTFSGQLIGVGSPGEYVGRIADRVFMGNGVNTVDIILLRDEGSLPAANGGILLEQAKAALPGVEAGEVPFSNRLARIQGARSATTFSSPTNLGLVYADWGWLGVYSTYFALGLGLALLERLLTRVQRDGDAFASACAIVIALWSGYAAVTGLIGGAVNVGVSVCLFVGTRLASHVFVRGTDATDPQGAVRTWPLLGSRR
jgi:hypothetical protein